MDCKQGRCWILDLHSQIPVLKRCKILYETKVSATAGRFRGSDRACYRNSHRGPIGLKGAVKPMECNVFTNRIPVFVRNFGSHPHVLSYFLSDASKNCLCRNLQFVKPKPLLKGREIPLRCNPLVKETRMDAKKLRLLEFNTNQQLTAPVSLVDITVNYNPATFLGLQDRERFGEWRTLGARAR